MQDYDSEKFSKINDDNIIKNLSWWDIKTQICIISDTSNSLLYQQVEVEFSHHQSGTIEISCILAMKINEDIHKVKDNETLLCWRIMHYSLESKLNCIIQIDWG